MFRQNQLEEKKQKYLELIQLHAEKLNQLMSLHEEENLLADETRIEKQLQMKHNAKCKFNPADDIDKLKAIAKQQREQIQVINREIEALKVKVKMYPSQSQSIDHE